MVGYYYVDKFERKLERICNVNHAVAVWSGTAALHLALLCVGVKRDRDVVCPSLTFAATANCIDYCNANPVFIDSKMNIEAASLRGQITEHTRAVIAVDLLGMRADIKALSEFCHRQKVPLVEDAAEAMGQIDGMAGADVTILSFNNNKIVTTNGGGALLTDDDDIAAKARELATTARVKHPWLVAHSRVGFNYRMGNLNAAVGCAQLERLDEMKHAKAMLARQYSLAFGAAYDVVGAYFIAYPWLNVIMVKNRDEVLAALHDDGVDARAIFTPLHLLPHFSHYSRSSNTMTLCTETWQAMVCLPSGAGLLS